MAYNLRSASTLETKRLPKGPDTVGSGVKAKKVTNYDSRRPTFDLCVAPMRNDPIPKATPVSVCVVMAERMTGVLYNTDDQRAVQRIYNQTQREKQRRMQADSAKMWDHLLACIHEGRISEDITTWAPTV